MTATCLTVSGEIMGAVNLQINNSYIFIDIHISCIYVAYLWGIKPVKLNYTTFCSANNHHFKDVRTTEKISARYTGETIYSGRAVVSHFPCPESGWVLKTV